MTNKAPVPAESQVRRIGRYRQSFSGASDHYGRQNAITQVVSMFAAEHGITDEALHHLKVAFSGGRHAPWLALLKQVRKDVGLVAAVNDLFAAVAMAVLDGEMSFSEQEIALYAIGCAEIGCPLDEQQHARCIDRILDGPRSSQRRDEEAERAIARYLNSSVLNERQREIIFDWWLDDHVASGTKPKTLTAFANSCATLTATQQMRIIEALLQSTTQSNEIIAHGEQVAGLGPEHHAVLLSSLLLRSGGGKIGTDVPVIGPKRIHAPVVSYARRTNLTEATARAVLKHLVDALHKDLTASLKLDLGFDPDKIDV